MTPATLAATLDELHWTTGDLAALLGCHRDRVRNWIRPTGYAVPPDVAAWLERRLDAHRQAMRDDPAPTTKGK
jgi:hypothetical protein